MPTQSAIACDSLGSEVILDRQGCRAFTSASLEGIKRISISRGNKSRGVSRDRSTISGIRLEYHGDKLNAVLGQWLAGFDYIELNATEELTEVKIWTKKSHVYTARKVYSGPIVRITVSTSTGRSKTFQVADDLSDCIAVSFRANRYENLVGLCARLRNIRCECFLLTA